MRRSSQGSAEMASVTSSPPPILFLDVLDGVGISHPSTGGRQPEHDARVAVIGLEHAAGLVVGRRDEGLVEQGRRGDSDRFGTPSCARWQWPRR